MARDWNVLVVEDEPQTAELVQIQLKQAGLRSRVARNGQEAILIAGSKPPELIVMDLMMPELDGFETSRYLKHKFGESLLPILVLTAIPDVSSRTECGEIGCDYLMAKPYDADELTIVAGKLVDCSRHERALARAQGRLEKAKKKQVPEIESEIESAVLGICSAREAVARKLLAKGYGEMLGGHVARIAALQPNHASLADLRQA